MTSVNACVLVVFGGTGDLTYRKLLPAIYSLAAKNRLSEGFALVAIGRRKLDDEKYRRTVEEALNTFSGQAVDGEVWQRLARQIYYRHFEFHEEAGYAELKSFLAGIDANHQTSGNRIYYLAVAPEHFQIIVEKLQLQGLTQQDSGWKRVVIEKPFGRDLASARALNEKITGVFGEENTFRIDHYLGKEMIQNIMVLRLANAIFEPIWNSRYIDHIQISAAETVGVGTRAGYYEQAGALRDMLQNHLLQLLTLTAMEPPAGLDTESIRDEKVKVLRSLTGFRPENIRQNVIRGQYGPGGRTGRSMRGYREEEGVAPASTVETFIALKAEINNFRWAGVPFYIRTGKRLAEKSTQIVIQFKQLPAVLYRQEYPDLNPNVLIIRIQPKEGVFFQFNAKKPGMEQGITPVGMNFCQNCDYEGNSPQAYEKLLLDVIRGDSTLFTRWDEVEYSWMFVDQIFEAWQGESPNFPNYSAGSWGPEEAEQLVTRDGRHWRQLEPADAVGEIEGLKD